MSNVLWPVSESEPPYVSDDHTQVVGRIRTWYIGETQSAMRRQPAVQLLMTLNGCLADSFSSSFVCSVASEADRLEQILLGLFGSD